MARRTVQLGKTPAPKAAPKAAAKPAPKAAARPAPQRAQARPAAPKSLGLGLGLDQKQRAGFQQAAQGGTGAQFLGSHPGIANRVNQVNPVGRQADNIGRFISSGQIPQRGPQPVRAPVSPGMQASVPGLAPQGPGPQPVQGQTPMGGMTQGPGSLPAGYGQQLGFGGQRGLQGSSPIQPGSQWGQGPSSAFQTQGSPMGGSRGGFGGGYAGPGQQWGGGGGQTLGSMQGMQAGSPGGYGPANPAPRSGDAQSLPWQGQVNQGMNQVLQNRMQPQQQYGAVQNPPPMAPPRPQGPPQNTGGSGMGGGYMANLR